MTTIDIWEERSNVDGENTIKLLQCLPNLENVSYHGDISIVFKALSKLNNLKTLKLFRSFEGPDYAICLKALEHLEISQSCHTQIQLLELPSLKKIILKNEDCLSKECLLSIINNSRNLESIDIRQIESFGTLPLYFSQILNVPKLKSLSLQFIGDANIFEAVEYFLRSCHKIPLINIKYDLSTFINSVNMYSNIIDIKEEYHRNMSHLSSALADRISIADGRFDVTLK